VPTDELDRRLAALAEAAQEHADAPAAAVIRARARWRRARNAAAAAMAVAAAAALLAVIRPALVRDSEVAGPSPSVSTSPGVVPWVREPARRRAPTPTSPGARPAERCSFGTSTSARAPSSSPSNWCVPDRSAPGECPRRHSQVPQLSQTLDPVRCRPRPWRPSGQARSGRRCQACCGTGLDGSSSAAPKPMSPITANEAIASA
jgi:hypothetical protein